MHLDLWRSRSVLSGFLTLCLAVLLALPAQAAEKTRLRVDDYQIDVELTPHLHQMKARAKVKFTALQDLSVAIFELNNDLRVTKVSDEKNQPLSAERVTQDSTVRIPLPAGLSKDATATLTFEYEGQLENADNSPVPGLKLAYISDDTSYLLYAGRWFPVSGFGLNRFTSTISVTIPAHMMAIGSGKVTTTEPQAPKKPTGSVLPTKTYTFTSTNPVSLAPSSPEFSRNIRATRPDSTCTLTSSPRIKVRPPNTPPPPFKRSRTSSRCMDCRRRRR